MFTGNKDTDKLVLMQLDDYDLANTCKTNKHLSEICADETFWRNRTLLRFGKYLGSVEDMKMFMERYEFSTWKRYYVSLIDFLEKVYDGIYVRKHGDKGGRIDYDVLQNIFNKNNDELIFNINKYIFTVENWKRDNGEIIQTYIDNFYRFLDQQINRDLIDPNVLFDTEDEGCEHLQIMYLQIKYLLNSKDKRIRLNRNDNSILRNFATNFDYNECGSGEKLFPLFIEDDRIDPNILLTSSDAEYIIYPYLFIIGKSEKIRAENYRKLMTLLINGRTEGQEEELIPISFRDFAVSRCEEIISAFKI